MKKGKEKKGSASGIQLMNDVLLREYVNSTDDCVYFISNAGQLVYVSPSCYEMTGYRIKDFLDDKDLFAKILYSYDRKKYSEKIKNEFTSDQSESFEFRIVTKNKIVKWVNHQSKTMYDADGGYIGKYVRNRDITFWKETEDALRHSEENLRKANIDKDKFFSILAHDLRSSFTGLIGLSQFLTQEFEDLKKPKSKELVVKINNSIKSIFAFIENMLEWARIQSGRMDIKPTEFSLTDLVTEVIILNKAISSKKKINIKLIVDKDIQVYADENMINVVVRNLLSNALKFSYSESEILIDISKKKNFVTFKIEDSGTGIRESDLENIFKIDKSISKTGTDNEIGTGLGLLLCKEFISNNGGKIWAESNFGEGSSFYFTLPVS